MNQTKISAIHHITAISASAAENVEFYEQVLGLRLVKQTVNFDDPYTYHLYYGDRSGSPGTILTFFPWKGMSPGTQGSGMIDAIAFTVSRKAIPYWRERLKSYGIDTQADSRFDDPVLKFSDPHGLPLELVGVSSPPIHVIPHESAIEPGFVIAGFHSATARLRSLDETRELLADIMDLEFFGKEKDRYRFKMQDEQSPGHFLDILVDPLSSRGVQGTGTVHHIAFRAHTDEEQLLWQGTLRENGFGTTEIIDRKYFKSIYFHEPGGVLFEIATDSPGFTVDEPIDKLASSLMLPSQYEPMRQSIERRLPPLRALSFKHEFWRPEKGLDDGQTIVALHGTGGNEKDLVGLSKQISANSAIISPKGKVLENGHARFFRRFAEGQFDENDVTRRAHELADFLQLAADRYHRLVEQLVALGYSNGANIAAAIFLLRPEIFSKAVLIRPMMPLIHPPETNLEGKRILILNGRYDPIVPNASKKMLGHYLERMGASVEVKNLDAGHEITSDDLALASRWLLEDYESSIRAASA